MSSRSHQFLIQATTLAMLAAGAGAGSLTPPGAPAPTTPALGDARTAITEVPITIDEPGSYYLTGHMRVTTPSTTAITIVTDEVTIDLNGFALIGPGAGAGSGGHGISRGPGAIDNITVVNGTIRDFPGAGVTISPNLNALISRLHIHDNGGPGITTGTNALVFDSMIRANGGDGIDVGFGSVIRNNSVRDNGGDGIGGIGRNATIIGNACHSNSGDGIDAEDSTITNNTCTGNAVGIRAVDSLVMQNSCTDNSSVNLIATDSTVSFNHAP